MRLQYVERVGRSVSNRHSTGVRRSARFRLCDVEAVCDQVRDLLPPLGVGIGVKFHQQRRLSVLGKHRDQIRELLRLPRQIDKDIVQYLERGGVVFED